MASAKNEKTLKRVAVPDSAEAEEGEIPSPKGRKERGGKRHRKSEGATKKIKSATTFKIKPLPNAASVQSASQPSQPSSSLLQFLSPYQLSATPDPLLLAPPAAPRNLEADTQVIPAVDPPPQKHSSSRLSAANTAPERPTKAREFVPRKVWTYYMKGRCEKGQACTFSHAQDPKKLEVCKFFKAGVCRKEENECLYSHNFKTEICIYYMRNECTAGAHCKYSHDKAGLTNGTVAGSLQPAKVTPEVVPETASATIAAASSVPVVSSAARSSSAHQAMQPFVIALSESSEDLDSPVKKRN